MTANSPPPRLLVVDDEPDLRTLYELTLMREGYHVDSAGSVEEAWQVLQAERYDLLITDMRLPDGMGLDLLTRLESAQRPEKAIVITAYGSPENAVEALKAGAYDYLTKPVDLRQFRAVVASALGRTGSATMSPARPAPEPAQAPGTAPRVDGAAAPALARLVGDSAAMREVRALVQKVSRSMAPVLIHGESGTGKELVARAVHAASPRGAGAFVAVNCGAIPEQLLEAEFFGYRKGAFTGAQEDRGGFFQAANGGTLFLDEIGDLPLAMQSKLLRAIQERAVRPIGGVSEIAVDARLVSASHKDLTREVREGRFRQDLYYRLNVIRIDVPPLRERLADLPTICRALLERIARDAGVAPAPTVTPDALAHLAGYAFPGNVRELENLLHRALALSNSDRIEARDLGLADITTAPQQVVAPTHAALPESAEVADEALPADLQAHLDDVEREILIKALDRHRYNRTAAGASLGLSLRQMRYRMARLGIDGGTTD
ncbi:sigma-54-dependent transcriptional regulator [Rubrivivax albus]|uniref:Sigma-54-dependent Fis family transcriptional regulator n=1 Tax=Rubrivivax albus TaxID=2499835 RepID=A0A3S3SD14_9BURK|nr:sigma-54 dependent transcriptional regulator [Rubrivivax albus]RVT52148.1 sigma-54-dependent Fis family transcriptional regulator [Rubrivivax albus]